MNEILTEAIGEGVYRAGLLIVFNGEILLHRELLSMIRSLTGVTITKTIETKSTGKYDSSVVQIKFDAPPPGPSVKDNPKNFLEKHIIPKIKKIKGVTKIESYGHIESEKIGQSTVKLS